MLPSKLGTAKLLKNHYGWAVEQSYFTAVCFISGLDIVNEWKQCKFSLQWAVRDSKIKISWEEGQISVLGFLGHQTGIEWALTSSMDWGWCGGRERASPKGVFHWWGQFSQLPSRIILSVKKTRWLKNCSSRSWNVKENKIGSIQQSKQLNIYKIHTELPGY